VLPIIAGPRVVEGLLALRESGNWSAETKEKNRKAKALSDVHGLV
jgi:hypothetical protein